MHYRLCEKGMRPGPNRLRDRTPRVDRRLVWAAQVAYSVLGTYSEYTAVPTAKLLPVPEGVGLDIATAIMTQVSTTTSSRMRGVRGERYVRRDRCARARCCRDMRCVIFFLLLESIYLSYTRRFTFAMRFNHLRLHNFMELHRPLLWDSADLRSGVQKAGWGGGLSGTHLLRWVSPRTTSRQARTLS